MVEISLFFRKFSNHFFARIVKCVRLLILANFSILSEITKIIPQMWHLSDKTRPSEVQENGYLCSVRQVVCVLWRFLSAVALCYKWLNTLGKLRAVVPVCRNSRTKICDPLQVHGPAQAINNWGYNWSIVQFYSVWRFWLMHDCLTFEFRIL